MCKKDRVSWHLIGMGTDTDMHGVNFQGNTIHLRGSHRDSLALFPHVSTTAFMQPDRAGKLGRASSGDQIPIFRQVLLGSFLRRNWLNLGTSGCAEGNIALSRIRVLTIVFQTHNVKDRGKASNNIHKAKVGVL